MLPAVIYFIVAVVAFFAAYRAGTAGGGKQRLGMASAGIGFILLGVDRLLSPKDTSNRLVLIVAGILLLLGIFLYWLGHLRS
jgi:predicted phage tail protein